MTVKEVLREILRDTTRERPFQDYYIETNGEIMFLNDGSPRTACYSMLNGCRNWREVERTVGTPNVPAFRAARRRLRFARRRNPNPSAQMKTKPAAKKDLPELKKSAQELFEEQFLKAWKEKGVLEESPKALFRGDTEVEQSPYPLMYVLRIPGYGPIAQHGSQTGKIASGHTTAPAEFVEALSVGLREAMEHHFVEVLNERSQEEEKASRGRLAVLTAALKKA